MQSASSPARESRFEIEPATWRDLSAIQQVEKACFHDPWPLLDLIAALTFPDVIRFKAMVDGKIVGFAGGDIRRSQKLGWITTIGVLPEYRRLGIGAALLEAGEEALAQPRVRLCVRRSNYGAIRLYEQHTYQQVGVWPGYYEDGEDALVMEKDLSAKFGKKRS